MKTLKRIASWIRLTFWWTEIEVRSLPGAYVDTVNKIMDAEL